MLPARLKPHTDLWSINQVQEEHGSPDTLRLSAIPNRREGCQADNAPYTSVSKISDQSDVKEPRRHGRSTKKGDT